MPSPQVIDLTTLPGATADPSAATRRALSSFAAMPPGSGKVLYLPAGDYPLAEPIELGVPNLTLRGDGMGRTVLHPAGTMPGVLIDAPSAGMDFSGLRPDAAGLLDASLAPSPGAWRGFSNVMAGDAYPRYWATSAACAPSILPPAGWAALSTLTVEVALASLPRAGTTIVGLGANIETGLFNPSPFLLARRVDPQTGIDGFVVCFRTQQCRWQNSSDWPRFFTFTNLAGVDPTRPCRIRFTIDMTRDSGGGLCCVAAGFNGMIQAVRRDHGTKAVGSNPVGDLSFGVSDRLTFMDNRMANFCLGKPGWIDSTFQMAPAGRPKLTVLGFSMSSDNPYVADSAGLEARADGGVVNDSFRYAAGMGRAARSSLCYFDGTSPRASRYVWYHCPAAGIWTPGVIRWESEGGLPMAPVGVDVAGLTVAGGDYRSAGVVIGRVFGWGLTLRRVAATGGLDGFHLLSDDAKYDVYFMGCAPSGSNAWVRASQAILHFDVLPRQVVTKDGLLVSGCDVQVGRMMTGPTQGPGSRAIKMLDVFDYGAILDVGYLSVDNEGAPGSPVYIESHRSMPTIASIGHYYPGAIDAAHPAILLADHSPGDPPQRPRLSLRDPEYGDPYFGVVGDDKKNTWSVTVDGRPIR